MLKRVKLENLVLVDSCEVHFSKGFTAITGETGSGKSVLLTAINLLLGEKADSSSIRRGAQSGIIEGDFLLPQSSQISSLFDEFSLDQEDPLCTIRRELFAASGKSRSLVNGCVVPLQFLKRLGSALLEISNQHAYLALQEESAPQKILDLFAGIEEETNSFRKTFEKTKQLETHVEKLLQEEPLRQLEMEKLQKQLQEIKSSKIFDTDDELCFSRLKELEQAKEIIELGSSINRDLDGGKEPLTKIVYRLLQKTEKLQQLSSQFTSIYELIEQASSSLRSASQEIQTSLDAFEYCEEECVRIETSLRRIDQVKRSFGPTVEEVLMSQKKIEERLSLLKAREDTIEDMREEIDVLKKESHSRASLLREKRTQSAPLLEKKVLYFLHLLHMPHALFEVIVSDSPRHATGDDTVRFFLTPNPGEKRIEVKDGVSGGEMARLFLAIQAVMAHLSSIPTIIFDEIDACIGGITAASVGDLLAAIGKERQVLAITHFTQVAQKASFHIALSKETIDGRTLSRIRELCSEKEKALEHKRMIGI